MPPIVGNIIAVALIVLVVGLAVRSLWRSHKKGGGCSCGGDCGSCGGSCHCGK